MNRWGYLCLCAAIGAAFGLVAAQVIAARLGLVRAQPAATTGAVK